MLSHVLYTYEEVNKGTSLEEIVENVSKRIQNNPIVFVPENLTALKNGGRLSPAAAAIGTILGIKPVIVLEDGALEKSEVVRNVKRAFSERIAKLIIDYPISDYDWSVIGFDPVENTINYVIDQVKQVAKDYNVITGVLPINVCAHCGPGTIGIIVSPKINGKSVNEFM
jgi:DegV family protein with EDD domain